MAIAYDDDDDDENVKWVCVSVGRNEAFYSCMGSVFKTDTHTQ